MNQNEVLGMTKNTNTDSDFLVCPVNGYTFDTHTEIQNKFIEKINKYGINNAIEWLLGFKKDQELSYPQALRFEWKEDGSAKYFFELSKNADFSDPYTVELMVNYCEIDTLEIGQKYFWRVNLCSANHFYTKDNYFRFVHLEGALNVRDIGGNKIKQGLLYRGSDIYTHYKLTEKGAETIKNRLKIKTEIDLRAECVQYQTSSLGDNINLVHLPYRPYKEVFEEQHRKGICNIMDFLSHEDNYPIYLHCLGGADRTGMIALYLRALAGESDELILLDYELTGLSSYAYGLAEGIAQTGVRSRNNAYFLEFLDMLDQYAPGKTFNQKVTNFLLNCGVSDVILDRIIRIITEP